jgi:hypothetical protein
MNSAAARSKSFAVGGRLVGGRNHGEQGSCPDAHAADWIGERSRLIAQLLPHCSKNRIISVPASCYWLDPVAYDPQRKWNLQRSSLAVVPATRPR